MGTGGNRIGGGWVMRSLLIAGASLGLAVLAGCGTPGDGTSLGERLVLGGTSVPPPLPAQSEDVYCPRIRIPEGGAAIQAFSGGRIGDASGLRNQVSLGELARECVGNPDGTTVVKIGVQGHVLLGAGGSAGHYDAPVHILVKDGDKVIANRARRAGVSIPAGESQASFSFVEEGIVVPAASAQSFTIEVGLGGSAPAAGAGRAKKR